MDTRTDETSPGALGNEGVRNAMTPSVGQRCSLYGTDDTQGTREERETDERGQEKEKEGEARYKIHPRNATTEGTK